MIAEITEQNVIDARRIECIKDGMYFSRYFFLKQTGGKMIVNRHHEIIQSALERTMLPPNHPDQIPRLIINVPPGYSKTSLAVINYIARGLAIDSRNRFLHLSYSGDLAFQNSASARRIIKSYEFQQMWPIKTRTDSNSVSIWWTTEGGGVRATSTGGQVTGFRAGHMDNDKFTGSLLIDDPIKPDDALSETKRNKINDGYNDIIASRLAIETVPIIVIMQRVGYYDLSGYLLRGGSGEMWYHLNLPVILDSSKSYPEENAYAIPLEHGIADGWLWPYKHNEIHEKALRSHRRKWFSQYMQAPKKIDKGATLWTEKLINNARTLIEMEPKRRLVSIDPAISATDNSDEHGIIVGSSVTSKLYQVEADYTCKGSPNTWAQRAIMAYKKHSADAIVVEINQGGDMCADTLRNAGYEGSIVMVRASRGKVIRAEPVVALYELGYVKHRYGLSLLEDEMTDFDALTGKSNGLSPNRVDALVWLITELAGLGLELETLLKLAMGE